MISVMESVKARELYINSRLADYTLRIANAEKMNCLRTAHRLEREKNEFLKKMGLINERKTV